MARFIEHFRRGGNVKLLRVGTQAANTPSLQLHLGFGFAVRQSSYAFHYHAR